MRNSLGFYPLIKQELKWRVFQITSQMDLNLSQKFSDSTNFSSKYFLGKRGF